MNYRNLRKIVWTQKTLGAIHSTKIQTDPTGKRGPPQKVDLFFRNFSGWTEPIHWVLDRNFRKFWLNGSRPLSRFWKPPWRVGNRVRNYSVCMIIILCRIISVKQLFWKKCELQTCLSKASLLRILLEKIWGRHMQLHALEPPFKIFYTFVGKKFSSCRLKFPWENCRQIHEKSKASVWRNFKHRNGPKNLSEQPFYGNYTTLESHIKWYCGTKGILFSGSKGMEWATWQY